MKKIINGKKYDTETAENLDSIWNGLSQNDFGTCTETLYRKKTGEFFLFGEGGPMTQYGERCSDNSRSFGEKIIPLSEEEARSWAEEKMSADDYEKLFGAVEE